MAARKTSGSAKKKKKKKADNNQFWSVLLFCVGVLVLLLTWFKGSAFWYVLHSTIRGLFGISAVFLAPIILYVAVMIALDKSKSAVITKIIQGGILVLLVSALAEIIKSLATGVTPFMQGHIGKIISSLFSEGKKFSGGGVVGLFLGYPLDRLFSEVGALIIMLLFAFMFTLLLTNITLVDLWRMIVKPWKRGYRAVVESAEEKAASEAEKGSRDNGKQVDFSKYINKKPVDLARFVNDGSENPNGDDGKNTDEEKNSDFPLPVHPVTAKKAQTKEKSESEHKNEKGSEKSESGSIIKDIARIFERTEKKEKAENNKTEEIIKNPIYVESDGQTTLLESGASESSYLAPSIELLNPPKPSASGAETREEIRHNSETLVDTLKSFGVLTRIVDIHRGPSVTRYELQPAAGVKVSKITGLVDDIALNLAAEGVRIEAPIPGKAAVGIELANKVRDTVCLRELIDSEEFHKAKGKLSFPVGRDIEGKIIVGDIAKMPHMLIAGTTGSGKSVFTNSIIMSILFNASPDEVKLILVDPKQVEFPVYNGIPHLLIPVVTEARKAAGALGWAVTEMLKRYKIFADNGVRDLGDYNAMAKKTENMQTLPQIVIIVDELADLMMAAPKEVEDSICRIAQLARAAGMHLIIATQSPRVDIVTGLIKANIPSRVALKVSNQIDSRVILDEGGADKLLGYGDLLYKPVGLGKPIRVQGSFVATDEIKRVVDYLKNLKSVSYDDEIIEEIEKNVPVPKGEKQQGAEVGDSSGRDEMIDKAIEVLVEAGQASTSFLQRRLKLGYARAARIMDELEQMGVIGEADGAKPRKVLITKEQWLESKVMKDN